MSVYRRQVGIVTGTRAEYGILRPVIQAVNKQQSISATLIVAGMHLLPEFGMTIHNVIEDGFHIGARVDMLIGGDSPPAMAKSVGLGIISMTQALCDVEPRIVVVLGDRGEAFAAAVAAAHMNIPVAHIHGGECTTGGNIDEAMRWSISRFAHVHFVATAGSRRRLIASGEHPDRVHLVGAPALDIALSTPGMSSSELASSLGVGLSQPLILVVQHPVTTEQTQATRQMRETMEAAVSCDADIVVIYPNADAGGKSMISVIEDYRNRPNVHIFPSLPHQVFLNVMRQSTVMVGNSSSAIIEAPSYALPAVNIGVRQTGRERGSNVIDAPHDGELIRQAIARAMAPEFRARIRNIPNPYGDGQASTRIADTLARSVNDPGILQKGTFQSEGRLGVAGP